MIQKRLSGRTWLPSIGRNSNSSRLCATMSEGPQHRRWEEHSLASLSMNCERYKWHLSFSLPPSQTTFSSSKHQNSSKKTPCDKERAPKTVTFDGMTVPLRSLNENYTKTSLTLQLPPSYYIHLPKQVPKSCSGCIWAKGDRKLSILTVDVSVLSRRRKPRNLLQTSSCEADSPKTIHL